MSSTVRNVVRYVLISEQRGLIEDLTIFVEDNSTVLVYDESGECFEGDMLALATLAKLHRATAFPVQPPPDWDNQIREGPAGDEEELLKPTDGIDWSEDQDMPESPSGGVNLEMTGSQSAADVNSEIVKGTTPDLTSGSGPSAEEAPIQGGLGERGSLPHGVNPYHDSRPTDIGSVMVGHESFIQKGHDWYGRTPRFRGTRPRRPMILARDLGNCLMGMPAYVGTTIAGPIRPDTGGKDPVLHDHIMWMQYGLPRPPDVEWPK
jgi:hypothetical protein